MTRPEIAIACVAPLTERLDQDALKTTLQAVLSDQSAGGLVTLILTDDTTLRRLNRDFRGIDAPTDVISFDLKDPVHPAGREIGEIYISLDRARVQARGAHRPLQEEIHSPCRPRCPPPAGLHAQHARRVCEHAAPGSALFGPG